MAFRKFNSMGMIAANLFPVSLPFYRDVGKGNGITKLLADGQGVSSFGFSDFASLS